ncbi:MAG: hypothetical protein KBD31_03710 [Proteobacteria bacterium]|nr:hypothetical protein [Pseudomonadota bacterium]
MSDMKYRISGRKDFVVPVVEKHDDGNGSVSKIPEWMIKIEDYAESMFKGYEKYCELFGWFGEAGRKVNGSVAGMLSPSATLTHSEVVIIIPVFGFLAELETKMNKGVPLTEVEIVRIGTQGKMQSIQFFICTINSIQQELDRAVIKMSIMTKVDTVSAYDTFGMPKGQKVSRAEYGTGMIQ